MTVNGFAPLSPAVDWEGLTETLLRRAVALGRRDGLEGQHRDVADAGAAPLPFLRNMPIPDLLLSAMRQCYAAGHAHGADVRQEGRRRRAGRIAACPTAEQAA